MARLVCIVYLVEGNSTNVSHTFMVILSILEIQKATFYIFCSPLNVAPKKQHQNPTLRENGMNIKLTGRTKLSEPNSLLAIGQGGHKTKTIESKPPKNLYFCKHPDMNQVVSFGPTLDTENASQIQGGGFSSSLKNTLKTCSSEMNVDPSPRESLPLLP